MTEPLFTADDVANLREFDNFLVAPRKSDTPYWMEGLADRIQQYLDQQASVVSVPRWAIDGKAIVCDEDGG